MALLLGILLFAYWLFAPTLLSALLPPAGRLGRDGTAVLLALASWGLLAIWLPLRLWPPSPLPPAFGLAALLALAVVYSAVFLSGLTRNPVDRPREGVAVTIAFLSPLSEEILFRGFLLSLALPLLGGPGAVVYSALLFLAAHEIGRIGGTRRSLRDMSADLVFGLLAGLLVLMTGTLLVPLLLHIVVNSLYAYGNRSPSR